jgi:hypothetical protein
VPKHADCIKKSRAAKVAVVFKAWWRNGLLFIDKKQRQFTSSEIDYDK